MSPRILHFRLRFLTAAISTFGIEASRKKGEKSKDTENKSGAVTTQILRIEQAPIKIITESTGK